MAPNGENQDRGNPGRGHHESLDAIHRSYVAQAKYSPARHHHDPYSAAKIAAISSKQELVACDWQRTYRRTSRRSMRLDCFSERKRKRSEDRKSTRLNSSH